jgi:SAM-dependent methyltransferase
VPAGRDHTPVIDPTTTRIRLELAPGSDPIAGCLFDAHERAWPFRGWVELTHVVDAAHAGSHASSTHHPTETAMLRTEPTYLLDPAWHAERDRLNSLSTLYDPTTLALCEDLGLTTGWRCLDAGAGTGSVAVLLAGVVGPAGSVLAVDTDTRFLAPLATDNLQVAQVDVTAEALPEAAFDLVHARLLLEHLPERDAVLSSLVQAVRPGGWLLVEDLDWATSSVIDPPSPVHTRVADACMALFAGHAYAPYYGRTLPRALAGHGLIDLGTRAESKQVRADVRDGVPQWELLVDQLGPGLLAAGTVSAQDLEDFHALWHDGHTVCFAPLMVSSWGRRPARASGTTR